MNLVKQCAAMLALALAMIAPASANIVSDHSFELNQGAWETKSWDWYTRGTNSGNGSAGVGCLITSNFSCTISQTLSTVAGQRYNLSFWLYADGVVDRAGDVVFNFDNGLRVWFGDEIVQTTINFPTTNTGSNFNPGGPSTLITISNILATSASTVLQFAGYHGPAGIYIDDVSVVGIAGEVPEPGSLSLLGLALAGLVLTRQRRSRRVSTN